VCNQQHVNILFSNSFHLFLKILLLTVITAEYLRCEIRCIYSQHTAIENVSYSIGQFNIPRAPVSVGRWSDLKFLYMRNLGGGACDL